MESLKPRQLFQLKRLGSPDVEDQVRQAVANIRLEGLQVSARTLTLLREVASGEKTYEMARAEIRSWHDRS